MQRIIWSSVFKCAWEPVLGEWKCCDFHCFLLPTQLWIDCRNLLSWKLTNVDETIRSWRVCVYDWYGCGCRFNVHLRSYDFPFKCFHDPPQSVGCEYGTILTNIRSCGERICRRDGRSSEQFTYPSSRGSGAHPLQWQLQLGALHMYCSTQQLQQFVLVSFVKYYNMSTYVVLSNPTLCSFLLTWKGK